jgi:NTP pyrophosphatase (non-canonical NTP hydrolase)
VEKKERKMNSIREYELLVRKTAIYPGANKVFEDRALTYTIIALAGESGELANVWKKYLRDPLHQAIPTVRLIDELGDILWYLVATAKHLGISLEDLMQINTEKLNARAAAGTIAHRTDSDNRESV